MHANQRVVERPFAFDEVRDHPFRLVGFHAVDLLHGGQQGIAAVFFGALDGADQRGHAVDCGRALIVAATAQVEGEAQRQQCKLNAENEQSQFE